MDTTTKLAPCKLQTASCISELVTLVSGRRYTVRMVLRGQAMAGQVPNMEQLLRTRSSGSRKELTASAARSSLEDAFKDADLDGSGMIDRDELRHTVCKRLQIELTDPVEDCNIIFDLCDLDGSGEIDFHEFCSVMEPTIASFEREERQIDLQEVMAKTFKQVLTDARRERALVIEAFGKAADAVDQAGLGLGRAFLGQRWRFRLADDLYHRNHAVSAHRRLEHLRERLAGIAAGDDPWCEHCLADPKISREVLDAAVIPAFAAAWLFRSAPTKLTKSLRPRIRALPRHQCATRGTTGGPRACVEKSVHPAGWMKASAEPGLSALPHCPARRRTSFQRRIFRAPAISLARNQLSRSPRTSRPEDEDGPRLLASARRAEPARIAARRDGR